MIPPTNALPMCGPLPGGGSVQRAAAWPRRGGEAGIAATAEALASAALRSGRTTAVLHPLGFVCLPLCRGPGGGICLHLWTDRLPATRPTTSPVHCHGWDLVSYVLYGDLANVLVAVVDAPRRPTHRVFEVVSGPGRDEIRPTGRLVRVGGTARREAHPGDVYRLPAGAFHMTTVPAGTEAATVAFGFNRPGTADRSLGGVDQRPHTVHRTTFGAAETALAIGLLNRHLKERRR